MSNNYFNSTGTIGFTCDVCGRELQSCTWMSGMRFCAKCYQETFGNKITTDMLLDMIKNTGWTVGDCYTVERLNKEAHNMELQQKVKVLEKALELACEIAVGNKEMNCSGISCSDSCKYNGVCKDVKRVTEHFKTKAKEMMKSE